MSLTAAGHRRESASNLAMPPWGGNLIARAPGASHPAERLTMGELERHRRPSSARPKRPR